MNINSRMADNPARENMFLSMGFNIIIPMMILIKGDTWLGEIIAKIFSSTPTSKLVVIIIFLLALSFPLFYGTFDLIRRRKWNLFSIFGIISVLSTGGIGLISGGNVLMYAIKESAIPAIIGAVIIISSRTKKPLIHLFLYNPQIINVHLVDKRLEEFGTKADFEKLLLKCTWLIGLSFGISAILNFFLAQGIVKTEPDVNMIQFNKEIGQMMGWSMVVIAIPCMLVSGYALFLLFKGIKKFTGLSMEQVMAQGSKKESK